MAAGDVAGVVHPAAVVGAPAFGVAGYGPDAAVPDQVLHAQSFGVVLLGMEWMRDPALQTRIAMDLSHVQTMLFLQLAAGGHMLLFVVRSRTRQSLFS